jgi:diadenosine tetraphosphate (Ap4A) HIT family hydrolase
MSFPLPTGNPCYFCEIVAGNTDRWNVIEETDLTMTVLNGRQFEIGQCIVLPLRHAPTILDLHEREGTAIMAAAKRLTEGLLKAFAPDGVLLYQNNGIGSGQEVPHFHLHVVPRSPGSDWGLGPPHIARLDQTIRPPRFDHEIVTQSKRNTVDNIRRYV